MTHSFHSTADLYSFSHHCDHYVIVNDDDGNDDALDHFNAAADDDDACDGGDFNHKVALSTCNGVLPTCNQIPPQPISTQQATICN